MLQGLTRILYNHGILKDIVFKWIILSAIFYYSYDQISSIRKIVIERIQIALRPILLEVVVLTVFCNRIINKTIANKFFKLCVTERLCLLFVK